MKKRIIFSALVIATAITIHAVPAYRGWQTKIQPDGTTIQVQQNGDEVYHYFTNTDGDIVRKDTDGYWRVVEQQPTAETIRARRAKAHLQPRRVGGINLAPRGLFILVNFADTKYKSGNTQAQMDSMMNAVNYTYGGSYGSARKYFIDQSSGAYTPTFDVVGPVTLTKQVAYYGKNAGGEDGNDMYPGDMVIEACKLAKSQFDVDFTQYDNDHDGEVDFVYVIYAGKGEADGGKTETIWPHNWNIESAIYYGNCTYTADQCKVDGLSINSYACSGELDGQTGNRNGIGTLCHEFGHVLGLPDFYDTNYGSNSTNERTPGKWDIMDSGSYNGDGCCPPNYSAFEKYFFGWATPINPGSDGQGLTLYPAGSADYQAYQINAAGTLQSATTEGLNYYIENRQQVGWDQYLPGHGMIVWYVDYSQTAWDNNTPNNTASYPRYTVESASGFTTQIGQARDPFPGIGNVTMWSKISGTPLKDIREENGVIMLTYKDVFLGYTVNWVADGETIESKVYKVAGAPLEMPTAEVTPCEGMRLIGWTTEADYHDPFVLPEDLFTDATGKNVNNHTTYYAVFE